MGEKIYGFSSFSQTFEFSPVVAIPHKSNFVRAVFCEITTETDRVVRMTPDHLLARTDCKEGQGHGAIDGETAMFAMASEIAVGDCVRTVDGVEKVSFVFFASFQMS